MTAIQTTTEGTLQNKRIFHDDLGGVSSQRKTSSDIPTEKKRSIFGGFWKNPAEAFSPYTPPVPLRERVYSEGLKTTREEGGLVRRHTAPVGFTNFDRSRVGKSSSMPKLSTHETPPPCLRRRAISMGSAADSERSVSFSSEVSVFEFVERLDPSEPKGDWTKIFA